MVSVRSGSGPASARSTDRVVSEPTKAAASRGSMISTGTLAVPSGWLPRNRSMLTRVWPAVPGFRSKTTGGLSAPATIGVACSLGPSTANPGAWIATKTTRPGAARIVDPPSPKGGGSTFSRTATVTRGSWIETCRGQLMSACRDSSSGRRKNCSNRAPNRARKPRSRGPSPDSGPRVVAPPPWPSSSRTPCLGRAPTSRSTMADCNSSRAPGTAWNAPKSSTTHSASRSSSSIVANWRVSSSMSSRNCGQSAPISSRNRGSISASAARTVSGSISTTPSPTVPSAMSRQASKIRIIGITNRAKKFCRCRSLCWV